MNSNHINEWLLEQMDKEDLTCYTCNQPCLNCSSYVMAPRLCNSKGVYCHKTALGAIRWCPIPGVMILAKENHRYCTSEMMLKMIMEEL